MSNKTIWPGRQWQDRLAMWAEEFPKHFQIKWEELPVAGFSTKERLSLSQAEKQGAAQGQPVPVGTRWGKFWEYGWFFWEWTVPEELEGKRIVFFPGVGEEMLLWVNGREKGSVDKRHSYVTLSRKAAAGEHFRITAECYAGHGPRREEGCFCRKGEKPFSDQDVPQLVTAPSQVAVWQEEIFQAGMDYQALYSLLSRLPERSLRAMKVAEGLMRFTTLVDFGLPAEELTKAVVSADGILRPLLECKNGSTAPEFTIFGQSHLDLAWLWTLEETRRKAARTYSNQLELMEEYPEYQFLLCEPPILEYLKESYPAVWERVKEKIKEGQVIPEGALYVECDTNMPCGESLARQFLYGKEWFWQELGCDCKLAWMPDTFGFSGALPQIMSQCGVPYFTSQKLIRQDPECEPFPFNDFWWQGIDGSRILGHTYKENNAPLSPMDMVRRWEDDRVQPQGMEGMLYPFGYGDGGGGPTRELLEMARRCADLEGAPRARYESPVAYFERLKERGTDNVFAGELYLSWHRGTYTAQAKTKKGVRRGECLLKEAEYWNTLLGLYQGRQPGFGGSTDACTLAGELKGLWKRLLIQEFHDILPGTGIARVHQEAEDELAQIAGACEGILGKVLDAFEGEAPQGKESQGEAFTAPPREGSIGFCPGKGRYYLKSRELYAELDSAGRVWKLSRGEGGEDFTAKDAPMNTLRLYRNVNGYYDAWEIGSMYEQEEEALDTSLWHMEESQYQGRPAWLLKGQVKDSPFSQRICISQDGCLLEFHTEIFWQERHRMLKVDFPAAVRAAEVTGEIAFGAIKRPVMGSYQWEKDRYEVCGHRYSLLEDGSRGIGLFNDSKYGYSAKEDRISLTLLRAPLMPDMYADQGRQEFSYACYPFEGDSRRGQIAQRAVSFTRRSHLGESLQKRVGILGKSFGLLEIAGAAGEPAHVLIESIKLAEEGSKRTVIRLYEAVGCPQKVRISFVPAVKELMESDILEREGRRLPFAGNSIEMAFGSFEIKTLMILK